MKFDIITETNEEYISVTYDCLRCIDIFGFLSLCVDDLVETLDNDAFDSLRIKFLDNWEYLSKKIAYPYKNSIELIFIKNQLVFKKGGLFHIVSYW